VNITPLSSIAVSIFGGLADKSLKIFEFLREPIKKADMKMALRTYVSLMFMLTAVSGAVSAVIVLILSLFLALPGMLGLLVYFIPPVTLLSTFAYAMVYPTFRYIDKRKSIESNLPFALTHIGSVAESGIPPYVAFKLLSQFEEYGEIAVEMKRIVRDIEVFGMDPLTAMKNVADRTPSDSFKQVLLGLITTTESGGDVKTYLKSAGGQALFEWKTKREKFLQQLSAYAEFYTGIVIAAPLFIIALFAVMALIQPDIAGFSIIDLTKLSIYIVVPGVNLAFLAILRNVEVEI
jgi:archaeal flagellar protein FlaJ